MALGLSLLFQCPLIDAFKAGVDQTVLWVAFLSAL